MENKRINPHVWIKISGSSWKCAACGLLKEVTWLPRTERNQPNKQIITFYMSGIKLEEKPKCVILKQKEG